MIASPPECATTARKSALLILTRKIGEGSGSVTTFAGRSCKSAREGEAYSGPSGRGPPGGFSGTKVAVLRGPWPGSEGRGAQGEEIACRFLLHLPKAINQAPRLFITLSDGKPDDWDHYRGATGIEGTRRAPIEAKRQEVHPFCITIDREAHDYIPHMYGAVNYCLVEDVRTLPRKIPDMYRRLTT